MQRGPREPLAKPSAAFAGYRPSAVARDYFATTNADGAPFGDGPIDLLDWIKRTMALPAVQTIDNSDGGEGKLVRFGG